MTEADDLQFQTAEFAAPAIPKCDLCRAEIADLYYHLNGSAICTPCAEQKRATLEPVRGRVFAKSLLYGAGAAAAGSALYGIVLLATGAEFALLSILVGIMVGKAMLKGSGGRGGRKLQIAAVLLTYGSITTGYVPAIVKGMYENEHKKADQKKDASAQAASPQAASRTEIKKMGVGRAVLAVAVFFLFVAGLSLVSPFFMVSSGFSGLLGIAIIFFGLQQAWKKTAPDDAVLTGPYRPADEQSAAASA